ncbi:hypothetical protein [Pseudosulfitobacter pseudonitzschiae]|uniref:hypothetical protein n=1 Tax=Pseudosulfitobacter pseudonitzschiae TaxID=1402135 RepID=UPI003B763E2B
MANPSLEISEDIIRRLLKDQSTPLLCGEAARHIEAQQKVLTGLLCAHRVMNLDGIMSILKDHVDQAEDDVVKPVKDFLEFMEKNTGPIASLEAELGPG